MNASFKDGWIVVDTDAPDKARVEIAVSGARVSKAFAPAFRDFQDGKLVAMVRAPAQTGRYVVSIRVDGVEYQLGTLTF